jgi:hypothetical protein
MVAKRRVVGIFSKEVEGISKGNLYCRGRIGNEFDKDGRIFNPLIL